MTLNVISPAWMEFYAVDLNDINGAIESFASIAKKYGKQKLKSECAKKASNLINEKEGQEDITAMKLYVELFENSIEAQEEVDRYNQILQGIDGQSLETELETDGKTEKDKALDDFEYWFKQVRSLNCNANALNSLKESYNKVSKYPEHFGRIKNVIGKDKNVEKEKCWMETKFLYYQNAFLDMINNKKKFKDAKIKDAKTTLNTLKKQRWSFSNDQITQMERLLEKDGAIYQWYLDNGLTRAIDGKYYMFIENNYEIANKQTQ